MKTGLSEQFSLKEEQILQCVKKIQKQKLQQEKIQEERIQEGRIQEEKIQNLMQDNW